VGEFDVGVFRGERPTGPGVMEIAVFFPRADFADDDLLAGDAMVEALRREDAGFGLGHPFDELRTRRASCHVWECNAIQNVRRAALLRRAKSLVEGSWCMGVERSAPDAPGARRVVLPENDFPSIRKVAVRQIPERMSVIKAVGPSPSHAASPPIARTS